MEAYLAFLIIACLGLIGSIVMTIIDKFYLKNFYKEGCISAIIGAIILCIISTSVYLSANSEYKEKVYNVYSLRKPNENQKGTFFIGIGYVETEMNYYFYIEMENGYKKLEHLPTENTLIKETNNVLPSVYCEKERGELNEEIIMYVPENTIQIEWQL